MHFSIHKCGSEEFQPCANGLDLCFTSPPYFDLEKYADEPTQSYKKFDNKEAWVEGFLRKTFENCYYGLKPDKYMIINIADVKGKHNINLEGETIRIAQEVGFKMIDTWFLALSNINLKNKGLTFKYEPIYLFKK
jgi:DNA modification methylase